MYEIVECSNDENKEHQERFQSDRKSLLVYQQLLESTWSPFESRLIEGWKLGIQTVVVETTEGEKLEGAKNPNG